MDIEATWWVFLDELSDAIYEDTGLSGNWFLVDYPYFILDLPIPSGFLGKDDFKNKLDIITREVIDNYPTIELVNIKVYGRDFLLIIFIIKFKQNYFSSLPDELVNHIMGKLRYTEIINLCHSSLNLNKFCSKKVFWIDKILARNPQFIDQDMTLAQLKKYYHVLTEGRLYTVGDNSVGQLGIKDSTENTSILMPVNTTEFVSKVSCGRAHTAFISSEGNLYTTGDNQYGQLGVDVSFPSLKINQLMNATYATIPLLVPIKAVVEQVSCGVYDTAVVTKNKEIFAWGKIMTEMGFSLGSRLKLPRFTNVAQVSCGNKHIAFITEDGKLYVFGQLDINSPRTYTRTPQLVPLKAFITQIASGTDDTLCIGKEGELYRVYHRVENYDPEKYNPKINSIHLSKDKIVQIDRYMYYSATRFMVITNAGKLFTISDLANYAEPLDFPDKIVRGSLSSGCIVFVTNNGEAYYYGNLTDNLRSTEPQRLLKNKYVGTVACGNNYLALIAV